MRKTHADKIMEAIMELQIATPNEIMDWIKTHYPDDPVNIKSYRSDIIGCSINHSSSHHYPSMPKFLWFDEDTKRYRIATTEEATIPLIMERREPLSTKDTQLQIDGIPISKLSITGQVHIPKSFRDELGLQAGDFLSFLVNEQGVLEIRKARLQI